MANNFRPNVIANETIVQIGRQVALRDMFSVSDLDPNSTVTKYRVRDNSSLPEGSFIVQAGTRKAANTWIEFNANQLNSFYYRAGLVIGNETFSVQAFDGEHWSNVGVDTLFTVEFNSRRPFVQLDSTTVLSNEKIPVTDFMSAFDPDGFPIDFYQFVDRQVNSNGGYFEYQGIRQASATWFTVPAEDLDQVYYVAGRFGPQSENVGVIARDTQYWSLPKDVRIYTSANTAGPDVDVFRVNSSVNRTIDFKTMFTWSDPDGNTAKNFGFYDSAPGGGHFEIDGVVQDSNRWIVVAADLVDRVKYVTASVNSEETVTIGVMDGRYWTTDSNIVSSVTRPKVEVIARDIAIGELERVNMDTLFTNADPNSPNFTQYQVYDENEFFESSYLLLDNQRLQHGQWHTLSASEFSRLMVEGAVSDNNESLYGRTLDGMLVRAYNGVFWSDIERINVNTDPIGADSLITAPSQVNPFGINWTPFWYDEDRETTVVTYNFLETFDAGTLEPFDSAMREATREILADFESYINIDFVEVPWSQPAVMEFRREAIDGPGGVLAFAFYPFTDGLATAPGDSVYDIGDYPFEATDVSPGSEFVATVIHELGHTLGLAHSFDGAPDEVLPFYAEHNINTVMSYTRIPYFGLSNGQLRFEESATMSLWDVVQAQRLYGANMDYNTGNDHYFFAEGEAHMEILWDAGGIDSINYTLHIEDEFIDLREGQLSSTHGIADSLRIAYNTVIENARGGRGNDTIIGNEIRNRIWGNEGNDLIEGGGGNDLLRGGAQGDIYRWNLGDGRDTIREEGAGGIDAIEFRDPSGLLNLLEDDFTFYRFGDTLRVDLTLDRQQAYGTVQIKNFADPESRVELMRIYGANGNRIGEPIDLNSVYNQIADNRGHRFEMTDQVGENGGYLVQIVS